MCYAAMILKSPLPINMKAVLVINFLGNVNNGSCTSISVTAFSAFQILTFLLGSVSKIRSLTDLSFESGSQVKS